MTDAVKRGMYGGPLPVSKAVSASSRTIMVETASGAVEVSAPAHVQYLEEQILVLQRALAIRESEDKKRDATIRRLTAVLKKLDAKIS